MATIRQAATRQREVGTVNILGKAVNNAALLINSGDDYSAVLTKLLPIDA